MHGYEGHPLGATLSELYKIQTKYFPLLKVLQLTFKQKLDEK